MLTTVRLVHHSVSGVSVGGVYTSLRVPELGVIFDAGVAPRSFVGDDFLFLSHGHADHVGALPSLIGVRGLAHRPAPKIYLPAEIAADVEAGVACFNRGQRRQLSIEFVGVHPGDEFHLKDDLHARVFRTHHSVPSVGYHLFRRVKKLRPEFYSIPQAELIERKKAGDDLFHFEERGEVAYVTDSLIDVLDENPELYRTKTLILECTFLDDQKTTKASREKFHVHLDEVLARAEKFENENVLLMHFSQTYMPEFVHQTLRRRLPESFASKVHGFAPKKGPWPG